MTKKQIEGHRAELLQEGSKAAAARRELDIDPFRTNTEICESIGPWERYHWIWNDGSVSHSDVEIDCSTVQAQRKKHGYPKPIGKRDLLPGCLISDCCWNSPCPWLPLGIY